MSRHKVGVPRNSPIDESLSMIARSGEDDNSPMRIGGGVLDLSGIDSVRGSYRGRSAIHGFVSTAISDAHHSTRPDGVSEQQKRDQKSAQKRGNNVSSLSPPSSSSCSRKDGFASGRRESNSFGEPINIGEDQDIQIRFAASVMPAGRRTIQPLPEMLETDFGLRPQMKSPRASTASEERAHREMNSVSFNAPMNNHNASSFINVSASTNNNPNDEYEGENGGGASFLSTSSSSSHQHHHNNHHRHHRAGRSTGRGVPSPLPKNPNQNNNNNNNNNRFKTPEPQPSARTGRGATTSSRQQRSISAHSVAVGERLYSQQTTGQSLQELSAKKRSEARVKHMEKLESARREKKQQVTGRASRVVCCPEDQARTGHLAQGIIIGSCERQAMERYLQTERELELEREARSTDKWKHEVELVKALNKVNALQAQVDKLSSTAENPRALQEAKMLRDEYETRWKVAQEKVEELRNDKVSLEALKEELELSVMKKEHECEGLRATVQRMQKTDDNHDDALAETRRKWFEEKELKSKALANAAELEKQVKILELRCRSYKSCIKGLENNLVVQRRKERAIGSSRGVPSPRPSESNSYYGEGGTPASSHLSSGRSNNSPANYLSSSSSSSSTPVGAARNASMALGGGGGGGIGSNKKVKQHEIDSAVKTLMGMYSSSIDSPRRRSTSSGGDRNLQTTKSSTPVVVNRED